MERTTIDRFSKKFSPCPNPFTESSEKKMNVKLEKEEFEKQFVRIATKHLPESVFWSTRSKPASQARECSCVDARVNRGILFQKEGTQEAWSSFYTADSTKKRQVERRKRAIETRFNKEKQMNSTLFEAKFPKRLPARLRDAMQIPVKGASEQVTPRKIRNKGESKNLSMHAKI